MPQIECYRNALTFNRKDLKCRNVTKKNVEDGGIELHETEFYKRADKKNGLSSWCIECSKAHANAKHADKPKRMKRDYRYDKFEEVAREYNRLHPFVRSNERAEHVKAMTGL